jgi:glutamyl-Q tRNA(Asp) synthetase
LHLGHAFSALTAFDFAQERGGAFVLRIEDIDVSRCRAEFDAAILEDLAWLGLAWEDPVRRQAEHFEDYQAVIGRLTDMGLTYPCFCTRKEITAEIEAAAQAPHGPDGVLYPGTCRALSGTKARKKFDAGKPCVIRLDSEKAAARLQKENALPLYFDELVSPGSDEAFRVEVDPYLFGDIVLARKDVPTSYHLSVVHDDHVQGITHVIRGEDLREATHVHRVLQALLGYDAPIYFHHALVRGADDKRLAKRDKAATLQALKQEGVSPEDVRASIDLGVGLTSR